MECYRDSSGDGVIASDGSDDPITYYEGDVGYKLEASITNAINDILKRVTSGTAASVLASGEGSGANLVQAVFYPLRKFSNGSSFDEIKWTGRIANLWYYVDPLFTTSNIREEDGDGMLNLTATTSGSTHDYIVSLFFDKSAAKSRAHRWEDPSGNGVIGAQLLPDIDFEALGNLWDAAGAGDDDEYRLLLFGFNRYKPHLWTARGFANGAGIVAIVFAGFATAAIRRDKLGIHDARIVAKFDQLATPVVGAGASFHGHHTRRYVAQTIQ